MSRSASEKPLIELNKAISWLLDGKQDRLFNRLHLAIWTGELPIHTAHQQGQNTRLPKEDAARRFPRTSDGLWAEAGALANLAAQSRLLDTQRALSRHHRQPKSVDAHGFCNFIKGESASAAAPAVAAAPMTRRTAPMPGIPMPMPSGFPALPTARIIQPQNPTRPAESDDETR